MNIYSWKHFEQQLYGYGARHIGVAGMTPLGCIPAQRTLKGGPHRKCAQDVNYAVQIFNTKLSIALDHLAKTLPDSKLVFMDIYSPFSQILENPADYGNFKKLLLTTIYVSYLMYSVCIICL